MHGEDRPLSDSKGYAALVIARANASLGAAMRTKQYLLAFMVLLAIALSLTLLAGRKPSMEYNVEVRNNSGQELRDVTVVYGDREWRFTFGIIIDQSAKVFMDDVMPPLPQSLLITWVDSTGESKLAKIDVPERLTHAKSLPYGTLTVTFAPGETITLAFEEKARAVPR